METLLSFPPRPLPSRSPLRPHATTTVTAWPHVLNRPEKCGTFVGGGEGEGRMTRQGKKTNKVASEPEPPSLLLILCQTFNWISTSTSLLLSPLLPSPPLVPPPVILQECVREADQCVSCKSIDTFSPSPRHLSLSLCRLTQKRLKRINKRETCNFHPSTPYKLSYF